MLEAKNISASFKGKSVFSDLSISINAGEIYCISGQSGCGKTTLGRVLAGLHRPDTGAIYLDNQQFSPEQNWRVQYLYQSPLAAMNPRWRIQKIILESGPIDTELAQLLGVQTEWADRYPHELSGGQLQRVSILRALGAKPRYLIADEITSALDPIAQAQIWHILTSLVEKNAMGIVAISHDKELLAKISKLQRHLVLDDEKYKNR
ncbi:ABC transporter ATP-binding protein [Brucella gallinifaecis]|uniref:ABC transporter ATP-binding protein n=1 Tax=Brucella gallinifaecis TaxID=215590 RepID=UPI00235FBE66|nr:ATP-binding cassette domain-containing protein [Brucella gallinifaecis]